MPGFTASHGTSLAECTSVCLEERGHGDGAHLIVMGDHQRLYTVRWIQPTAQMRRNWNDYDEATEFGACGIAIMLAKDISGHAVVERSKKTRGLVKSGFDYWLGDATRSDLFINRKVRLEVSGLRNGTDGQLQTRVDQKIDQTKVSDHLHVPAYVIIVEFGRPVAHFVVRA
jgi:hypothetical protein